MHFQYFLPSPALRDIVYRYAFYHTDRDEVGGTMKFLPTGCPFIIHSLGDPFTVYNDLYPDGIPQSGSILVGQQQHSYTVVPGTRYMQFTALLKPTAVHRLFGRPLDPLLNNGAPLEQYLPSLREPLRRMVGVQPSDAAALIEAVENYLLAQRKSSPEPADDAFDGAVDTIVSSGGMVTVSSLAGTAGMSPRHFRRAFTQIVGINPKGFIRIIRLQNVLRVLRSSDSVVHDWCRAVLDYGYYDQTHFIKEFKAFCGMTPSAYARRIAEEPHLFERFFLAPPR